MRSETGPRRRVGRFVVAGLLVAAGLALFIGPFASGAPDGLNRVAIDKGFDRQQERHALDDGPVAGYAVTGVKDDRLSTALAGAIGVAITFCAGLVAFRLLRPRAAQGASTRARRRP